MLRWLWTFGVGLLSACAAQGQVADGIAEKIDSYIGAEMERQRIPGLALAIVERGEVAFLKGYGFSNLEHQVPVKAETVFQSGSIAKQFTAAAVMLLVEDGRLSLDDPLSIHFPDSPASWERITVRHLLTHTSGMGDYPADFDLRHDHSEEEYLTLIKAAPLAFPPGDQWDYSNLGYVTLGILIHKVSGQFYGDFLAERVFRPLGMTTARVISEIDLVPNRAAGYRIVRGEWKHAEWVSPSTNSTADGSLYITILDLIRWEQALYSDLPLSQSNLARMWTPAVLNDGTHTSYGFGWSVEVNFGHRTIFHGGAWQGFKSMIVRLPDEQLTVIVLANAWNTRELKLAREVLALFRPEFALPPATVLTDRERHVTRLAKTALLELSKGGADRGAFTAEAQARLFPEEADRIGRLLRSLSVPIAIIHEGELVERWEADDSRHYRYRLIDLGKTLSCTVRVTKEDEIDDVTLTRDAGIERWQ